MFQTAVTFVLLTQNTENLVKAQMEAYVVIYTIYYIVYLII